MKKNILALSFFLISLFFAGNALSALPEYCFVIVAKADIDNFRPNQPVKATMYGGPYSGRSGEIMLPANRSISNLQRGDIITAENTRHEFVGRKELADGSYILEGTCASVK
jgi:hypothetical protein